MDCKNKKLAQAILNKSEFIELVAVLAGIKPAMRLCVDGVKSRSLSELASSLGLAYIEAPYVIVSGNSTGGFIHTAHIEYRKPVSDADLRHVYLGADHLAAHLVQTFETTDDRRFGLALGYPKCCVEFFCQHYSTEHFDLIADVGAPTNYIYNWQINRACRHFDYGLISHFPCHWDCPVSMQIAQDTHNALEKADAKLAAETAQCLESDVIYTPTWVLAIRTEQVAQNIDLTQTRHWINGISDALRSVHISWPEVILTLENDRKISLDNALWLPFFSQSIY